MPTNRVWPCVGCHRPLNYHIEVKSGADSLVPKPGDVIVCGTCRAVNVVLKGGRTERIKKGHKMYDEAAKIAALIDN